MLLQYGKVLTYYLAINDQLFSFLLLKKTLVKQPQNVTQINCRTKNSHLVKSPFVFFLFNNPKTLLIGGTRHSCHLVKSPFLFFIFYILCQQSFLQKYHLVDKNFLYYFQSEAVFLKSFQTLRIISVYDSSIHSHNRDKL